MRSTLVRTWLLSVGFVLAAGCSQLDVQPNTDRVDALHGEGDDVGEGANADTSGADAADPDGAADPGDDGDPGDGNPGDGNPGDGNPGGVCAAAHEPLACMATAGCFWKGDPGTCVALEVPRDGTPLRGLLTGTHYGKMSVEGVRALPRLAEADAALSLYHDANRVRGVLTITPGDGGDGDLPGYGYHVEGTLIAPGTMRLELTERECIALSDLELCKRPPELGRQQVYTTYGVYDGTKLVFGPAALRPGVVGGPQFVPETPFVQFRLTPHDGFKPAHEFDGQRTDIEGLWSGGATILATELGEAGRTGFGCAVKIEADREGGFEAGPLACGGLNLAVEAIRYAPATGLVTMHVRRPAASHRDEVRLLLVGKLEERAIGGLVVRDERSAALPGDGRAVPIDPARIASEHVIGAFRFHAVLDAATPPALEPGSGD